MTSKIKDKFDKQGYLIVRNVLDFKFDLKPVLNDIEFLMNRLVYKFVSKKKCSIIFKYNFWEKYTFLSKLNIKDFDQYFNIRLPKENIKKKSDFFTSQAVWNLIKNKNILDIIEKLIGPEIFSNPVQNSRIDRKSVV